MELKIIKYKINSAGINKIVGNIYFYKHFHSKFWLYAKHKKNIFRTYSPLFLKINMVKVFLKKN